MLRPPLHSWIAPLSLSASHTAAGGELLAPSSCQQLWASAHSTSSRAGEAQPGMRWGKRGTSMCLTGPSRTAPRVWGTGVEEPASSLSSLKSNSPHLLALHCPISPCHQQPGACPLSRPTSHRDWDILLWQEERSVGHLAALTAAANA